MENGATDAQLGGTGRGGEDPSSIVEQKALRREQRRQERLDIIRRGARAGCDGFKLLPSTVIKFSNTIPLGLQGMGMSHVLYSLHLTGHWDLFAVAVGMMLCFGGGTQVIAGCLEYARGNTLSYTIFLLNGCFWLSVVGITNLPDKTRPHGSPLISKPTMYFEGVYYLLWVVVYVFLLIATLRTNFATIALHATQLLWFILLAGGYMSESTGCIHGAGYVGVVAGGFALYISYAQILNEVFDHTVLPVFPAEETWKRLSAHIHGNKRFPIPKLL